MLRSWRRPAQKSRVPAADRCGLTPRLDSEELTRLRALEQDVRWNKVEMDREKAERLGQYLAGKSEISAGDALVLRHLHAKARSRQRYALGLPMLAIGIFGLWAQLRRPS